jgi:hypothetical protein
MTDQQLVEFVAAQTGLNPSKIDLVVAQHRFVAMSAIFSATLPYWLKTDGTVSLVANDYLIDLKSNFGDFWKLKSINIVGCRPMACYSDTRFRTEFPDSTLTGQPFAYMVKTRNSIQVFYRCDGAYTAEVSYYYKPSFDSISDLPDEWHYVVLAYCLAMMLPEKFDIQNFYRGLTQIGNNAALTLEDDSEFIPQEIESIIPQTMNGLSR